MPSISALSWRRVASAGSLGFRDPCGSGSWEAGREAPLRSRLFPTQCAEQDETRAQSCRAQRSSISHMLSLAAAGVEPGGSVRDPEVLREVAGAAVARGDSPSPFPSMRPRYASQRPLEMAALQVQRPFLSARRRLTCHGAGKETCLHLKLITSPVPDEKMSAAERNKAESSGILDRL